MSEKFSDEADRAAFITANATDQALAKHFGSREKFPHDFDGRTCYDCGEEMPEYRLAIPSFRCMECQSIHEKVLANNRKFFRGE